LDPLRIFVGFDSREALAYHVCVQSIVSRASRPLSITPLALNTLHGLYKERHEDGSNDFIYSRFLVPYLCGFSGPAIYLDGDMIVRDDIVKLFELNEVDKDVMVVKHDYKTKATKKYLKNANQDYPRKNWSSVMIWNCGNYPNRVLTPEFVSQQDGAYLHRFSWIEDERIGRLPKAWNWLVGEYDHNDDAKLLHYTLGIPAFEDYRDTDHATDWWNEFHAAVDLDD
jgi:lipopolysaccharide biosynthesis glycosyltransferase